MTVRRTLWLIPALALCCSCAFSNRENRHLVPWVEEHMVPESTGGRILAAPVVLPVGIVAGILDAFIFHPITVIDDAYRDTAELVWHDFGTGYVTSSGVLPFKTIATPIVFTFSFLGRAMFDTPPNENTRERSDDELAAWARDILSENRGRRMAAARSSRDMELGPKELSALLAACRRFNSDAKFLAEAMHRLRSIAVYIYGRPDLQGANTIKEFASTVGLLARQKGADQRSAALDILEMLTYRLDKGDTARLGLVQNELSRLYTFYVNEGDRLSEVMCCLGLRQRDDMVSLVGDAMVLQIARSLERRNFPAYAGMIEAEVQRVVWDRIPAMRQHAIDKGWRVARVRENWAWRVDVLLHPGLRPKASEAEAVKLARVICGKRMAGPREMETLLTHPRAVLAVARAVDRAKLPDRLRDQLDFLIADIETQIDAEDFVRKLADMSKEDFKAFAWTARGVRQPKKE
jgi:hypothetical protein